MHFNFLNPLDPAYVPFETFRKSLPWWLSTAALIVYIVLLFAIQRGIFHFLRKWVGRRESPWYGFILRALDRSITLFLLSGTIGFVPLAFSLPPLGEKIISLSAKLLTYLASAIFFQNLILAFLQPYFRKPGGTHPGFIRGGVAVIVYTLFVMFFLNSIGISVTPLIASLGVGSVAVAFALQETLASLFAGLYIVTDHPIRHGDSVRLESGEEGVVESIGWRSSRIRRPSNNTVIIPNSKIANGIITNYSLPSPEMAFSIDVGVDYESDLEKVEKVTLEIAREVMKSIPVGADVFFGNPEDVLAGDTFDLSGIGHDVVFFDAVNFIKGE
ncbi:MAG: mechanosensitive ion channel family protein [Deltaproteobacteria bacterium]|nr:mechanosensitive ion channel family protein [Deltaproteobacteria bacterium]